LEPVKSIAPTTAPFRQPAAGAGVELDIMTATPIANAAGTKIALMLAAFQRFRDVSSNILARVILSGRISMPSNISVRKCNPLLFAM
jgi:hypothetical protein